MRNRQTVSVTYDLPSDTNQGEGVRGAKSLTLEGRVVRSQIGEFKTASGKTVSGVRLSVIYDDEEDLEKELIEVPAHAQNVQVHIDQDEHS